jgi:hypothetical protein
LSYRYQQADALTGMCFIFYLSSKCTLKVILPSSEIRDRLVKQTTSPRVLHYNIYYIQFKTLLGKKVISTLKPLFSFKIHTSLHSLFYPIQTVGIYSTMRGNHHYIVLTVAYIYIGAVHGLEFGTIFTWLKNTTSTFDMSDEANVTAAPAAATATDCNIDQNRRTCKFNTASLKLNVDTNSTVALVVNAGGRTITCDKSFNKRTKRWYGTCDGDADDANFITRVDHNGTERVFGSIHVGTDICRIGPNIHGEDEIQCIPQSYFAAEDDPVHPDRIPKEENPGNRQIKATGNATFGFVPAPNQNNASQSLLRRYKQRELDRELFDDVGNNIDIMVLWTKAAECGNAGLASTCSVTAKTENMMRGLIDLAIAETNTAYELSGIFTMLRLVHAYRDSDYAEGGDLAVYLNHLAEKGDGFLDSVHTKRILYGADIVNMIVGMYIIAREMSCTYI